MRLICPHCMSGVTVSDDMAGKDATCPNCGKSFPTPARYAATVVPEAAAAVAGSVAPARTSPPIPEPTQTPAAPAGYVPPPPASSGFLPPEEREADVPVPTGYTRSIGFTISPKVVAWLPVAFLGIAFLLTFFPWVGTYLGGSAVYSQGPWRAIFGSVNRNTGLEAVAPPGTTGWTDKVNSDWYLMIPFILLLLAATALAVADRVLQSTDPQRLPPPVQKIWPMHHTLIAGLSVAAVAFVVIQAMNGFGLERAARQVARENPALVKEREAAGADKPKLAAVEQKEEEELRRMNLERTTWMHLSIMCVALGAMATIGYIALDRRGNKPPPKVLMHY